MGAFDGLRNAKIFERGTPLTPIMVEGGEPRDATYTLEITACKVITQRGKGQAFIAEFNVLSTDNTNTHADGAPVHPVGCKRSWFQGMADLDIAYPAIKVFLLAATGVNVTDKSAVAEAEKTIVSDMEDAVREVPPGIVNALAGQKVRVTVRHKMTAGKVGNPSHPFSVHTWEPLAG